MVRLINKVLKEMVVLAASIQIGLQTYSKIELFKVKEVILIQLNSGLKLNKKLNFEGT